MSAFYHTKEISINADDVAEVLVDQMYDDGDAFADLINKTAEALYQHEFEGDDAFNYARRLNEHGRQLIHQLHAALKVEASRGKPE